jgi:hypothetical protein
MKSSHEYGGCEKAIDRLIDVGNWNEGCNCTRARGPRPGAKQSLPRTRHRGQAALSRWLPGSDNGVCAAGNDNRRTGRLPRNRRFAGDRRTSGEGISKTQLPPQPERTTPARPTTRFNFEGFVPRAVYMCFCRKPTWNSCVSTALNGISGVVIYP